MSQSPTEETYTGFLYYYNIFNKRFFDGKLPHCLITYQRGKSFEAYYMHKAFKKGDKITDEIAMNPEAFIEKEKKDVLATFLHECVHLWQFHFGKPSRGGYHNKEWADKMEEVGLQPFGVGRNNYGKRTGQALNHKIIEGGVFEAFLREDDSNVFEMWVQRHSKKTITKDQVNERKFEISEKLPEEEPTIKEDVKKSLENAAKTLEAYYDDVAEDIKELSNKSGAKLKYKCFCGHSVWGKVGLKMLCLDCKNFFLYEM